jgi:hypothetical protein
MGWAVEVCVDCEGAGEVCATTVWPIEVASTIDNKRKTLIL